MKKEYNPVTYFPKWLKANARWFKYQPVIVKKKKDCIYIKFKGITANIRPCIRLDGIHVAAIYNDVDHCFDLLMDYDFGIEISKSGKYRCSECISKRKKAYDTAEDLINKHLFEVFLRWSNKNISEDNLLAMIQIPRVGRCASIVHRRKLQEFIDTNGVSLVALISLREWVSP